MSFKTVWFSWDLKIVFPSLNQFQNRLRNRAYKITIFVFVYIPLLWMFTMATLQSTHTQYLDQVDVLAHQKSRSHGYILCWIIFVFPNCLTFFATGINHTEQKKNWAAFTTPNTHMYMWSHWSDVVVVWRLEMEFRAYCVALNCR